MPFLSTASSFNKLLLLLLCLPFTTLFAQNLKTPLSASTSASPRMKQRFYFNWGYNRAWFNPSDIHFVGQGHNFVLYAVEAGDRPSEVSLEYLNPALITIPQFNFRLGYFISKHLSLSLGWDHMKYVALDFQTVKMDGYIDPTQVSDGGIRSNMRKINRLYAPDGRYDQTEVRLTPNDFIHFEHTDGLNYASMEIERYLSLWQDEKRPSRGLNFVGGAGAGAIVPRTDAHLFGSGRNHYWNLSGWGMSGKIGFQFHLFRHFYVQSDFKSGFLQMLKIHTTEHPELDRAEQKIEFYEWYGVLGWRF